MTTAPTPRSGRNPYLAALDRIGVASRRPVLTAGVFGLTAAVGVTQLVHPQLFDLWRRDGARIDAGEWWRLGTGMFVQDGWLAGLVFNLVILAMFGAAAERVFGRTRWLLCYFGGGLFGQTVSYLWLSPVGAGNSMCVAALIGALATAVLLAPSRLGVALPRQVWLAGFGVPVLAVVDTLAQDNHGLPALLGMAMGLPLLPRRKRVLAAKRAA